MLMAFAKYHNLKSTFKLYTFSTPPLFFSTKIQVFCFSVLFDYRVFRFSEKIDFVSSATESRDSLTCAKFRRKNACGLATQNRYLIPNFYLHLNDLLNGFSLPIVKFNQIPRFNGLFLLCTG